MRLFYQEDRDLDFLEKCESIRKEHNHTLSMVEIAKLAAMSPARSFYISKTHCARIIRHPDRFVLRREHSKEMHREIVSRAKAILEENNSLNSYEVAEIILSQPAPRFYISGHHAVKLYYNLVNLGPWNTVQY